MYKHVLIRIDGSPTARGIVPVLAPPCANDLA